MKRFLSVPLALILLLTMLVMPASAHGCHYPTARSAIYQTVRNDFYQNANSGVYFRKVGGWLNPSSRGAPHVQSTTNNASSWMFLELRRTDGPAMARVGYRFDADGSIHRYRHLVSPTGTTLFNTVESTNRTIIDVDSSELRLTYVDGSPDQMLFQYSPNAVFQQPFHTIFDQWDLGGGRIGGNQYRWRFDVNDHRSQFFGWYGATFAASDTYYQTQYGSANGYLTRTTWNNQYWSQGGVYDNGRDALVWDSDCVF